MVQRGIYGLGLAWGDLRQVVSDNAEDSENRLTTLEGAETMSLTEQSADPADPPDGSAVMWMSDGTGTGDAGDILMKITSGGTTATATIVDYSTL